MATPEDVQELLIGYPRRIKIDLDRFGMVAEASVGRGRFRAPAIAHACPDDTLDAPEPGVRPPESAEPKGGGLDFRRYHGVNAG